MSHAHEELRHERRRAAATRPGDSRRAAERDYDRLIHSPALRRLGDVTQVESSGTVHTRLTHSLEVAQVGRRLSQRLLMVNPELQADLDPEVVAAAGLAHDLGHPPFGHVGEHELNAMALSHGGSGFEGNAQSLRVVTHLAAHSRIEGPGLNLSRATLRALLKYPWTASQAAGQAAGHVTKYSAYPEELGTLHWICQGPGPHQASLEAQVMDYADDVTYAVHDLGDYARAGRLPLHLLVETGGVESFIASEAAAGRALAGPRAALEAAGRSLVRDVLRPLAREASGPAGPWAIEERCAELTSALIARASISGAALEVDEETRLQLAFLKALIWQFVIDGPQTGVQQHGARRVTRELFSTYHRAARLGQERRIFAPELLPEYDACAGRRGPQAEAAQARLACDAVASLSETQASRLARQFSGTA